MWQRSPPEFEDQLDDFLRLAGKKIYSNPTASDFTAWVRQAMPTLFPLLLGQILNDPEEVIVFMAMVARNLYADFPLPALGLIHTGQTKQGRNDPCDCGSGYKFKQRCGNNTIPMTCSPT